MMSFRSNPALLAGVMLLIAAALGGAASCFGAEGDAPATPATKELIKARIHLHQGRIDEALSLYADLVSRFPDNMELRADYIEALLEAGRLERAKRELDRLLAARPNDLRGRYLLARWHLDRGDPAAAFKLLERLCRQHPNRADLKADYGRTAQRLGLWLTAATAYKESLAIDPEQLALRRELRNLLAEHRPRVDYRLSRLERAADTVFWRHETRLSSPISERFRLELAWSENWQTRPQSESISKAEGSNGSLTAGLVFTPGDGWTLRLRGGPRLHGPGGAAAGLGLEYRRDDRLSLRAAADYNLAWDDPIEAAERNGTQDLLGAGGEWSGLKPLVFQLNGQWQGYYLENRSPYADRYWGSALVGLILMERPYLNVYYSFYYARSRRRGDSLLDLLIDEEAVHSAGFYLEGYLRPRLSGRLSGAARYDSARNLSSFEAAVGLKLKLTPRLSLEPSYVYTSEVEAVGGGESHLLTFEMGLVF